MLSPRCRAVQDPSEIGPVSPDCRIGGVRRAWQDGGGMKQNASDRVRAAERAGARVGTTRSASGRPKRPGIIPGQRMFVAAASWELRGPQPGRPRTAYQTQPVQPAGRASELLPGPPGRIHVAASGTLAVRSGEGPARPRALFAKRTHFGGWDVQTQQAAGQGSAKRPVPRCVLFWGRKRSQSEPKWNPKRTHYRGNFGGLAVETGPCQRRNSDPKVRVRSPMFAYVRLCSPMFAYVRLCSPMFAYVRLCSLKFA